MSNKPIEFSAVSFVKVGKTGWKQYQVTRADNQEALQVSLPPDFEGEFVAGRPYWCADGKYGLIVKKAAEASGASSGGGASPSSGSSSGSGGGASTRDGYWDQKGTYEQEQRDPSIRDQTCMQLFQPLALEMLKGLADSARLGDPDGAYPSPKHMTIVARLWAKMGFALSDDIAARHAKGDSKNEAPSTPMDDDDQDA